MLVEKVAHFHVHRRVRRQVAARLQNTLQGRAADYSPALYSVNFASAGLAPNSTVTSTEITRPAPGR